MKRNGLLNEPQNLWFGFCRRDTPRKIGDVGPEAAWALLNNNHVTHVTLSF